MITTVVNVKKSNDYDICVCRPSKWGNPFILGIHGSRKEVVDQYDKWLDTQPQLLADLHELIGRRLGCVCFPKLCHAGVLARRANELARKLAQVQEPEQR